MVEGLSGLLLASGSPRRREMVKWLGVPVDLVSPNVDETPLPDEPPEAYVRRVARAKARTVMDVPAGWWVLAADTAVVLEGQILGKPRTAAEAQQMLQALRARVHTVLTAVALRKPDGALLETVVSTQVHMRAYTDAEIAQSLALGTPFDKAGGYAIQDPHLRPVAHLGPEPCFANVVGLPLCAVWRLLHRETGLPYPNIHERCWERWGYVCPIAPVGNLTPFPTDGG